MGEPGAASFGSHEPAPAKAGEACQRSSVAKVASGSGEAEYVIGCASGAVVEAMSTPAYHPIGEELSRRRAELSASASALEAAEADYAPHEASNNRLDQLMALYQQGEYRGVAIREGKEVGDYTDHVLGQDAIREEIAELRRTSDLPAGREKAKIVAEARHTHEVLREAYDRHCRAAAPYERRAVAAVARVAAAAVEIHRELAALDSLARAIGPGPGYDLIVLTMTSLWRDITAPLTPTMWQAAQRLPGERRLPPLDDETGRAILASVRSGGAEFGDLERWLPEQLPRAIDGNAPAPLVSNGSDPMPNTSESEVAHPEPLNAIAGAVHG